MKTVLIKNAKIYQGKEQFAQAALIENEIIRAVGTDEEMQKLAPQQAEVIDAGGKTILPGFNDSHQHLMHVGKNLLTVNLYSCKSVEEMLEAGRAFLASHALAEGEALAGWGWNQDYFEDRRLPDRRDLDKVAADRPVIFTRACGHILVCNTYALQAAHVWEALPQVEGGCFDLGEDGYPNGVVRENAKGHIYAIMHEPDQAKLEELIASAMAYASSKGITSVQTNDVSGEDFEEVLNAYGHLAESGKSTVRVYMQSCLMEPQLLKNYLAAGHNTGRGSDMLKTGPLKLFVDGSLGARTALMRRGYHDAPGTKGIATLTQDQLNALVQLADENGMQVAVHAIGDKAIEMVLDAYATVIRDGKNPHRHGIVHCQITDEALLKRFAEMDIHALVQPIFLHYDMHICEDRVGPELTKTSYAFHTMDQLGLHVSYGTDSPVEDMDPIANIHCAVTRRDLKQQPKEGFVPEEKVDIWQAIEHYTQAGAYNSFEEQKKGCLQPGYLAELVMLDQDIFHVPEEEILKTKVLMTMMGGNIVYRA